MMVTLDARRLEGDFGAGVTLQALIDQVRVEHLDHRLVVGVAINGRPLSEVELEQALGSPLGSDDQIDLESGDRAELVATALRAVAQQIAAAAGTLGETARQLTGGGSREAIARIGEFVETWQTCQRVILECCGVLGQDLTKHAHDGRTVTEHMSELAARLRELRAALEARDLVLLADVLNYELTPSCELWHGLLVQLADDVASA